MHYYENKFIRISLLLVTEAIRADETASKLNLPTELSTFGQDAMNMADDSTLVTIANIDPNNRYLNDQDAAHETLSQEMLPIETAAKEKIPETLSEASTKEFVLLTTRVEINYIYKLTKQNLRDLIILFFQISHILTSSKFFNSDSMYVSIYL